MLIGPMQGTDLKTYLDCLDVVKSDVVLDRMTKVSDPSSTDAVEDFGSCAVCGLIFQEAEHPTRHLNEFVPKPAVEEGSSSYQCMFCFKPFRDNRAKMQHENFCSRRGQETL